jgi:HAD superfamily hydrolase (TIGR01509 family)
MSAGGGGQELTDRLGAALDMSGDEAYQYLNPYWRPYLTGEISEGELWSGIEAAIGRPIATAERNIWNTWEQMQPLPEMVGFVESLKQKSIPVGLVSNTFASAKQEIRQHDGYSIFDFVVLSDEIGSVKPDIEIHQYALEKLGAVAAEEVVFVDDQERCLAPARTLGMQAILATNPAQVIEDVSRLVES